MSGQRAGIVEPRVGWMERGRAPRGWGLWPSHPAGAPRRGAGSVVEAEALSAKGTTGLQQMPRLPEQVGMLSSIPSVQPPVPCHRPRPAPAPEHHPPLKGRPGSLLRSPSLPDGEESLSMPMPESGKGVGQGQGEGHAKKCGRGRPPTADGSQEAGELPLGPRFFAECVEREGPCRKAGFEPRMRPGNRGSLRPWPLLRGGGQGRA